MITRIIESCESQNSIVRMIMRIIESCESQNTYLCRVIVRAEEMVLEDCGSVQQPTQCGVRCVPSAYACRHWSQSGATH
eukprot:COSAG06_NODE_267_length_18822_cov_26.254607_5_plen_79_part_00